ncbi:MAG: hypothetical protein KF837_40025 [Labilithrix sp.]|nr:hypothetical protein [Labilithrix sp.]
MMLAACHEGRTPTVRQPAPETRAAAVPSALSPQLEASFKKWEDAGPSGDDEHRGRLAQLATAVRRRLDETKQAEVLFVCTHNSRRSHMAQLLGLAAARRKGLNVRTFSGGTEATAFNPRAIAALQRVGFEIGAGDGTNPHYSVRMSPSVDPVEAFSKRLTDPPNPTSGFIVVMTCSQADTACPYVQGAVARIPVPYDDPKIADGTPEEAARYDERVAQIGRDLAWVFGRVSSP